MTTPSARVEASGAVAVLDEILPPESLLDEEWSQERCARAMWEDVLASYFKGREDAIVVAEAEALAMAPRIIRGLLDELERLESTSTVVAELRDAERAALRRATALDVARAEADQTAQHMHLWHGAYLNACRDVRQLRAAIDRAPTRADVCELGTRVEAVAVEATALRERLAAAMIRLGIATGHGDTFWHLVVAMEIHASEREARLAE